MRQGTAGSLTLHLEFRTTSPGVIPAQTPPANTFVPAPSQSPGATVFPGGTQSVPPVQTPPSASQPPAQRPAVSIQIEPVPTALIVQGQPFRFYVRVTNTGTIDANNVTVLVQLPEEFRDRTIAADWSTDWNLLAVEGREPSTAGKPTGWTTGQDKVGNQAALLIPTFSSGSTAFFLLEYPPIGPQGYNIVCTVVADETLIGRESRRIAP